MKITDIQVDSFGHWKDLELPGISAGVTVIHGPNEAGKSTLLHLMRAVLYGFSSRYHARFVPPRFPGSVGGRLQVQGPTGRFAVRRWLPDSNGLRSDEAGDLAVRAIDGSLQGKHLLASLLSGVDDAIFRNIFAVGLSEMQHLGTLSDTEAARQLYGLAAGADRVSIAAVSRQLEQRRHRQMQGGDEASIVSLLKRRQEIRSDLQHEQDQTQHWLNLYQERRKISDEIAKLERRQQRFGEPLASAESRHGLRAQWKSLQRLHRQLESLGTVPDIPVEEVQRLDRFRKELAEQRKAWEKLRERRRQLREQSRGLAGHPALLHHGEAIQSLQSRTGWIADLAAQVMRSKTSVEETEFELQAEFERLGLKSNWRVESLPLITDEMIADLREPSQLARNSRQQGEAAEQAEREGSRAVEQIERQLETLLKAESSADLNGLLRRQEKLMGLFRQRVQLQGQLDTANRQLTEARDEYHRWAQRQLLPWRGLMGLGLIFALGSLVSLMALFSGFFRIAADQRWTLGLSGLSVCAFSLIVKGLLEFAAGRGAARCRAEIASVHKQIHRLCDEIERIEPQLPLSHEPYAVQLNHAEQRWQELSDLKPLEQQRLEALQRVDQAREEKERAARAHKDARQIWRDRLRHHGLPESMTPSQFRQLAQPDSKVGNLRRRLIELHRQHTQQSADFKEIQDRLQMLFERAGQSPDSDRLEEQIEQIFRLLQDARQNHQQRETLHRNWRDLGREQQEIARTAQRLQKRRQQVVAKYGVLDTRELKAMVKRQRQAERLRKERDKRLKLISDQLGAVCTLAQLRKGIEGQDFERRLRKWESAHDETAARLAALLERRGEIGQQIKTVATQRPTLHKRLQLQETQAQLDGELQRWQAAAGISSILNTVRQSYETDRQPETLAEASGYLNKMTDGRYQRIWTPFGESSLCVDDRDGKPVQVENLSRGTREQVFLSLRLALAAAYSRRGAALPLILDDVFVNFDAQRARFAAETIVQFAAAGHQVLVFTCHDHIRDVFWGLGVDLRELPDAHQNAQSPQPVLPSERLTTLTVPESETPERVLPAEAGLPTEGDPELDHELLYGAPEYNPGYQVPRAEHSEHRPRRRRRRRPPPPQDAPREQDASMHVIWRSPLGPPHDPPVGPSIATLRPAPASFWGEVAEYGEWFPRDSGAWTEPKS